MKQQPTRLALTLVLSLAIPLALTACATTPAPTGPSATPAADATPAPAATPAAEAPPAPEAAPSAEVPPGPAAAPSPAPAPAAAPVAASSESSKDPGDPRAQCEAGGARACLTLCAAEADVCDSDDSKDKCKEKRNEKAKEVASCADTGFEVGRLCTLEAAAISPTQAAVGMVAVGCKARAIAERGKKNLRRYLLRRPVPMVVGPDGGSYITDRHHTSTGVLQADIEPERKRLFMCPMANRQGSDEEAFWRYMEANNFAWLYSREGDPIGWRKLPGSLAEIGDDPYRTLSRWVRDSCGYIKCGTVCGGDDFGGEDTSQLARCKECPVSAYFLEFHWANYLRREIGIDGIYDLPLTKQGEALRSHLEPAMTTAAGRQALDLGLPGWNSGLIDTQLVRFEDGCDQ